MTATPYAATETAHTENETELAERAVRALLRRASRARKDPADFFEFVVKEERTGAKLQLAPHQRVIFSFVEAHPRAVLRLPSGASKTYTMATLGLHLLGNDPTERGAIISAAVEQAKKPLSMMGDYIEDERGIYPELHLVFPELRPSTRAKDAWQQSRIVVDRRAGIRDPSVAAVGYGGKLPGSRLSWILVDDLLTEENTRTAESRRQVNRWVMLTVLSRRDVEKSRIMITNTPYNSGSGGRDGDLTYMLEAAGWPTLTMDLEGDITIANADPHWDCPDIRPAFWGEHTGTNVKKGVEVYRLSAHDSPTYGAPPVVVDAKTKRERLVNADELERVANDVELQHYDVHETIPLWPEKFPPEVLNRLRLELREQYGPVCKCVCRDDATALCKVAYIAKCKMLAHAAGFTKLLREYRGQNPTVTGVDLAFGLEDRHDETCHLTIELIPELRIEQLGLTLRNVRRLIDIEFGRIEGIELRDRSVKKHRDFRSFLKVEDNGAQTLMLQMIREVDTSIPVLAHTTGRNKHHRHLGIVGLFHEFENGAWLIPSEANGDVCEPVQKLIDHALEYTPTKHAGDGLMAAWIARSFALEYDESAEPGGAEDIARTIAAR